ncbi:hypothetical protein SMMN14_09578, partial [Sphaerulina musiva]
METMEYNYFSPASQQYDYMAFDAESSSSDLGVTPILDVLGSEFPTSGSYAFQTFDTAALLLHPAATTTATTAAISSPQQLQLQLQQHTTCSLSPPSSHHHHHHHHSSSSVSDGSSCGGAGNNVIAVDSNTFISTIDTEFEIQTRRNSSEEKENLTPAQSRRKAQNRAAQRAFRERKERHVRDLEAKLHFFATRMAKLQEDNERLEGLLRRVLVEKEEEDELVGRRADDEEEGERL